MTTHSMIYLDYNATTPCAPEVVESMLPFLLTAFGNPASSHFMGREASRHVEAARCQVAEAIGSDASEIVFTGGATESNNLALLGIVERSEPSRRRILVSATEHKSVLATSELLSQKGFAVATIPVDQTGLVRLDAFKEQLDSDVLLVSVHAANNEVGTVQPLRAVAELAHQQGALVHCDAAQALGKMLFRVDQLDIDMASLSGHKVYAPKGIGALYIRQGLAQSRLAPILAGGGQESGLRPGTLNVPGIVGMGVACGLARSRLDEDMRQVGGLRDQLEERLLGLVPGIRVNGHLRNRLPGTSSITVPGVPADAIVANVSPLCVSAGSACTSGAVAPSHVLLAMGMCREDAECTIRISLGRYTTRSDIDAAVELLSSAVSGLRAQLA